jgi:adenylyltransferase/sulfurtransferase
MDQATKSAETLRRQIAATEEELSRLREQLAVIENEEVQNLKGLSLERGSRDEEMALGTGGV